MNDIKISPEELLEILTDDVIFNRKYSPELFIEVRDYCKYLIKKDNLLEDLIKVKDELMSCYKNGETPSAELFNKYHNVVLNLGSLVEELISHG